MARAAWRPSPTVPSLAERSGVFVVSCAGVCADRTARRDPRGRLTPAPSLGQTPPIPRHDPPARHDVPARRSRPPTRSGRVGTPPGSCHASYNTQDRQRSARVSDCALVSRIGPSAPQQLIALAKRPLACALYRVATDPAAVRLHTASPARPTIGSIAPPSSHRRSRRSPPLSLADRRVQLRHCIS
jgi:hypothetical protein